MSTITAVSEGMLVRHSKKPEWGLGKVLVVEGVKATIFFKDDSALRWATYERLLEMGTHLLRELQPLGAKDFIDVQSFMWVIEKY